MGFFSKLFARGSAESNEQPTLSKEQIEAVINAYAGLLAQGEAGSGIVSDTKGLPFPKNTIKEALQVAIRVELDTQKEQLKVAYISLADWQDGVGPKPVGMNLLTLDLNGDPQILAQALANQDLRVVELQKQSDAEMQFLKNELVKLGLW